MSRVADAIIQELEESVNDLITNFGNHEDYCTNKHQKLNHTCIPPCTKHIEALKIRKKRVELAFEQYKLLRDVFSGTRE